MSKTILITGASAGIGAAAALYFADRGWNVAATMRNPESAPRSLNHPNIICPRLDVTDSASIEQAMRDTAKRFGPIDVLVNNAGYGLFGPLEALSDEQIERQIQTNVYGVLRMMRAVIPSMRTRRSGLILNVTSIGGRMAFPFTSAYHLTKFAVEGLSESFRFEAEPHGIRVKVIEPGGIKTDFSNRSLVFVKHPAYEPTVSNYQAICHDDRFLAEAKGVAEVIYRAATDSSSRLRYAAKPGPFFLLNRLLPDRLWRSLVQAVVNLAPGKPAKSSLAHGR